MTNGAGHTLKGRVINCIIFDLGSTIWTGDKHDSSQVKQEANRKAGAILRQHVQKHLPNEDDAELGRRLRAGFNAYLREMSLRNATMEPKGAYAFMHILPYWGIEGIDEEVSAAIYEALRIPESKSRRLFEDSIVVLEALQERGYKLGVVTNRYWGGKAFVDAMDHFGLLRFFDPDKMAVSADLGIRKPLPEAYMYALNALGVAPENAAMVGNSLSADVVGPQKVGMLGIWRPKQSVTDAAKMHLAARGGSIEAYNAGQTSLLEIPVEDADALPRPVFKSLLADILDHAGYWDRFARGEVKPDLIIERLSDLLVYL